MNAVPIGSAFFSFSDVQFRLAQMKRIVDPLPGGIGEEYNRSVFTREQPMMIQENGYGKRGFVWLACLFVFGFLAVTAQNAVANETSATMIRDYANNLRCAGFEMRDEIKTHFRHSKGYGKMLGLDAKIRTRSKAVDRRVCRDACYRGLERDVRKLKEWTCELTLLYDQAVCRAAQCLDPPIPGDTMHVVETLVRMNDLANGMCFLASESSGEFGEQGLGVGIAYPSISNFDPNVEFAPKAEPEANKVPQLAPRPEQTRVRSEVNKPQVVLEAPLPTSRSVLEK